MKLKTRAPPSDKADRTDTVFLLRNGISSKQARSILVEKKWKEPLANSHFRRVGNNEKINDIHSLAFKITKETRLSIFQFKLVHNIPPHRMLLHKTEIVDSPLCSDCINLETLTHMLVSCPLLETFWSNAVSWWNSNSIYKVSLNEFKILFVDWKIYIYRQKLDRKIPTLASFFGLLDRKSIYSQSVCFDQQNFRNISS